MADLFDPNAWAQANAGLFSGRDADEVLGVVELWRAEAEASGIAGALVAGPAQRHLTARGTGLPTNFALVVAEAEVVAVKFDPGHQYHPIAVTAGQFGKRQAAWPRDAVAVEGVEPGRMSLGFTLRAEGRAIPCRTPRLAGNPAAAAVISALGGTLPNS